MSMPGSPVSSSSGDDFAALVERELQLMDNEQEEAETTEGAGEGEYDEADEADEAGNAVKPEVDMDNESEQGPDQGRKLGLERQSTSCPPHPGFMWDVCIRCGKEKPYSSGSSVSLRYMHEGLELTSSGAERMRFDELARLKASKKLYLVLDLDHTLLNSARFVEVTPEEEAYLATAYAQDMSVVTQPQALGKSGERQSALNNKASLHRLEHFQMWTKIRPFVHKFLEEASKLFEMYVYTMGERIYALAMARILDPTGRLFGDRVISQRDSTKRHTKDLDIVLGAESAVVILDDTERVWPKHRANLVLIERYHFFSASCRQYGVHCESLSQSQRDEREFQGTLQTVLDILRSVHAEFFNPRSQQGANGRHVDGFASRDVRQILEDARSRILKGCGIVFSRIIPTEYPEPEKHPFWRLTEELGAQCFVTVNERTTHVVALDRTTDKSRWARSRGVHLVHPSWVEAAQYLWRKPAEEDFPVGPFEPGDKILSSSFVKTVEVVGAPRTACVDSVEGASLNHSASDEARKRALESESEPASGIRPQTEQSESVGKKQKLK